MSIALVGCNVAESLAANIVLAAYTQFNVFQPFLSSANSSNCMFFFLILKVYFFLLFYCGQSSFLSFFPLSKNKREYLLHLDIYNLGGKLDKTGL